MLPKITLVENISRKTAYNLHRYLIDFAEGTYRLFWTDNRASVEVNRGHRERVGAYRLCLLATRNKHGVVFDRAARLADGAVRISRAAVPA